MANPHLEKNSKYSKTTSLLIVAFAYIVAFGAAAMSIHLTPSLHPIIQILIADIVATIVIWLAGLPFSNASFYDPYWSVIPVGIAAYWWSLAGFDFDYSKLLFMLVLSYWAIRLTSNWAVGWTGLDHEDWRYQDLRASNGALYQFVNLFGICLLPTILVFLGMLPGYIVLAETHASSPLLDIFALVLGISAVTIQWVSDEQMRLFRKKPRGNSEVMRSGLWAWSRHPNYFGEVLMWTSLFLFAVSAAGTSALWTGVGTLSMLILFLFISIPMMDKRSAEKRPEFARHMKNSSAFFLMPPRKND